MTYEQLAQIILFTIRIDIRCQVIHYLGTAMRHVGCFFLLDLNHTDS